MFRWTVLLIGLVSALPAQTIIEVTDDVIMEAPRRPGINIGGRSQWGASQIRKNMIDNPGLEPGLYGTVFHVDDGATGQRIPTDFWDTSWNNDQYGIGMPEGFWNGAEWEIVYGPAAGRSGVITNHTHEDNQHVFYLDSDGNAPGQWDVMFVRREMPGPSNADPSQVRPGSAGMQSLRLEPQPEIWQNGFDFFMDSAWRDGDRTSGKMFIVEGRWRIAVWARGNREGAGLRVRFQREGEANFLVETIPLTTEWQLIEREFTVAPGTDRLGPYTDDDYHPLIGFHLAAPTEGDVIWVDDVELMNIDQTNPTIFSDAFVDRLRELQPGVLRAWKTTDFGTDLTTMIAPSDARRTTGWRPHERRARGWDYSFHEFLELCALLGAEPWQVFPPTLPPEEWPLLVEYLAAPADGNSPWADARAALGQVEPWTEVFDQIHIEFGNELWGGASGGDPFYGASLLGGDRLGHIASDRFGLMRDHPLFDADKLDLIIGGQAGWSGRQAEIEAAATHHDTVALAPYFGVLDTWASDEEIYGPLFAMPQQDSGTGRMRESFDHIHNAGQGTEIAIYEINFHTTHGNSPIDVRNDFVAGAAGALALPLHLLTQMRELGIDLQCNFSALQYAFRLESGEWVRLWGMLRDLHGTGLKRPTWLGVEAMNHAVVGDLLTTVQSGDNPTWTQAPINGIANEMAVPVIQSFAFGDGESGGIVLFNLSLNETQPVELRLPSDPGSLATMYQIAPASIHLDNEETENVVIDQSDISDFAAEYAMELPPHSLTVLRWPPQPMGVVAR